MKENGYNLLVIGTAGRHVENFISRVKPETNNIFIICDKRPDFKIELPFSIVSFSLKSIRNYFSTPKVIRKKIKEFEPDVIHIHQMNAIAFFGVLGARNSNVPIVVTAWGSDVLINPRKSFLLKKMVQYIIKKSTAFTADSKHLGNELQKLSPSKKIDVEICNFGVEEVDIPIIKENVIYSNRLHNSLYRIDKIIHAFHKFNQTNTDWKLVVGATGKHTDELKELVKTLNLSDNVEFIGFVSTDINNEYYAKSKLYISIPESDATAISLLEAMYFKCIPVVSDLISNQEWIENNKTGILVEDVEKEFITAALELLSSNAGDLNRAKVIEDGTASVSTKRFTSLHKKLIQ